MTPRKFRIYKKAFKIKQKNTDELMWLMGQYVLNAVSVSLDMGFNGAKAKSKYVQEPLLARESADVLSQEDKQKLDLKLLEWQLKIQQTNVKIKQELEQKRSKEKNNG